MSEFFRYKTDKNPSVTALSNSGTLAVVTKEKCSLIFSPNGEIINTVCGENNIVFASYANGRFGFITNANQVIITDENGRIIKDLKIKEIVKSKRNIIGMGPDGFVACDEFNCGFYDFGETPRWLIDIDSVVISRPIYYKGYWYIPDATGIKIVKDIRYKDLDEAIDKINKNTVDTIPVEYAVAWIDICGGYLAITSQESLSITNYGISLFNIANPIKPREMWTINEFRTQDIMGKIGRVAFGPTCRYFAVVFNEVVDFYEYGGDLYDIYEGKVKFFNIKGKLAQTLSLNKGRDIHSNTLDWKGERLVFAESGTLTYKRIHEYKIRKILMSFLIST